jgi:hypothetical protein
VHCRDEWVSGLVGVVSVYIPSLKMAAPLLNCTIVGEQTVYCFILWKEGIRSSEIYRRLAICNKHRGLLHDNVHPYSTAAIVEAVR